MPPRPLCIDLDGTLLRTDTLWETAITHLKKNPLDALKIPFWLLRGRAFLKQQLARKIDLDPGTLPYTAALLEYLQQEHAQGRPLILVSGCDRIVGERIAGHLGFFSEVIASDGTRNLTSRVKAALLVERFGPGGFDYIGNEAIDLPVWDSARIPMVANGSRRLTRKLRARKPELREFAPRSGRFVALLRALRCHQYAKNVLIFVPLITAHAYFDWASLAPAITLFVAWCLAASGVYIGNDLLDLEADRRHPLKRLRPFAAGDLPLAFGVALAPLLLVLGIGLAVVAGLAAATCLVVYLTLAFVYSFWLKKHTLVDVFVLACLFTIRVIGGGFASNHPVSNWLMAFSGFLFLGLAFLKRCSELIRIQALGRRHTGARGYGVIDLGMLEIFGVTSAFMAALILGDYLTSPAAEKEYRWPGALWVVAPCLLLWVCRLWLSTARGEMEDDPLVYSVRDRVSWILAIGVLIGFILATTTDPAVFRPWFTGASP